MSLLVALGASEVMVRGLTQFGARLGLSEGLLGLLTALGADAPELSAAVVAVLAGSRTVGAGVVLGSNLFNLAALLGLAAVVSGGLDLHRPALVLDGAVGLAALLLAGLLLFGVVPALAVAVPMALLFAAYAAALALRPAGLRSLRLPQPLRRALVLAPGHAGHAIEIGAGWGPVALLPLAVAAVVAGSFGLVHSALELAHAWRVAPPITGGLVLAVMTSLPNAYAAIHLGRRGRGTAVLSEAMNSNTINLLGGLVLPALFLGGALADSSYWWLVGLTLLALGLPVGARRLGRRAGLVVVAGYLGFVAYTLLR